MLIPVFTLYAPALEGASPVLIGLALGIYGLSQGVLQMPFGLLSDRYGRKPLIALGLILFAVGSLVGAISTSIYGVLLARLLQGMGAVGSVLIALLADLTPDDRRTQGMAVIGMTIGLSFSLAMVLSPVIAHHFGLAGIFYLTALLALAGLAILFLIIPTPQAERFHADSEMQTSLIKSVLHNPHLLRLDLGIFCQHFILTASFYALPLLLKQQMLAGKLSATWEFYLPLMLVAFVLMLPLILLAEKRRKMKPVFLMAVGATLLTQGLLALFAQEWLLLCLLMFLYFTAFNFLEASLPSLISKQAYPRSKGTAMGLYSTSQFLGIFAGGAMAGILFAHFAMQGIFIANALLAFCWLLIALPMNPQAYRSTVILSCPSAYNQTLLGKLANLPGVLNLEWAVEEQVIYLQVDRTTYQNQSAENLLKQEALGSVGG